ncbi:unnamed protein product [Moneuplotes crassus]|uniref:Uncharacterized protein n=1 Tax=Euplotes crassus TaxID=5936 RepID=A0AAD2D4H7_EUPCR|nr:unnamed protein product [Moneuplotes crassus]
MEDECKIVQSLHNKYLHSFPSKTQTGLVKTGRPQNEPMAIEDEDTSDPCMRSNIGFNTPVNVWSDYAKRKEVIFEENPALIKSNRDLKNDSNALFPEQSFESSSPALEQDEPRSEAHPFIFTDFEPPNNRSFDLYNQFEANNEQDMSSLRHGTTEFTSTPQIREAEVITIKNFRRKYCWRKQPSPTRSAMKRYRMRTISNFFDNPE